MTTINHEGDLILYPRLSTRSRRAIRRVKKRWGQPYEYRPRGNLLRRLANETGQTLEWVFDRLLEERAYLISQDRGE